MQTVIKVMNSPQLPRKGRHYQDKKNILRHLSWFAPPPSFYNSTLPELRTMLPFTELRKRKKKPRLCNIQLDLLYFGKSSPMKGNIKIFFLLLKGRDVARQGVVTAMRVHSRLVHQAVHHSRGCTDTRWQWMVMITTRKRIMTMMSFV